MKLLSAILGNNDINKAIDDILTDYNDMYNLSNGKTDIATCLKLIGIQDNESDIDNLIQEVDTINSYKLIDEELCILCDKDCIW